VISWNKKPISLDIGELVFNPMPHQDVVLMARFTRKREAT
jgi:hypothetical protein